MKWIKASERNPDKEGEYFIRHKNTHEKEIAGFFIEQNAWWVSSIEMTKESIEWLDESPTEIGQQGRADKLLQEFWDLSVPVEMRERGFWEWHKKLQRYIHDKKHLLSPQPTPPQEGQDELWEDFREQWVYGQIRSLMHSGFSETNAMQIAPEQWQELKSKYKLIKQ